MLAAVSSMDWCHQGQKCMNLCRKFQSYSNCNKVCNAYLNKCPHLFAAEEETLMSQDQEEQSMSKVCRWNTCFKNCMNATGKATTPVRATCKANCKCWFLENEVAQGESSEVSTASCTYYAQRCKAYGYRYVYCATGYCSNLVVENEAALEEETSSEVATASCYYYAQRCKAYGYKYVYCSTGYCSNLAVAEETRFELSAAPCYYYAQRCKSLGYKYVYCSTGGCSNY